MKRPKISVLMPVYNTPEEYLRPAIESVLNQTFRDFELIILDDGSTNNAIEVIRSYSDPRIRLEQNGSNRGLSYTRQKICTLAKGEYIACADSDDISVATRFEKQIDFLEKHPDISICGALYEMFPDTRIPYLPETVHILDMLKGCAVAQPVVMYRRLDFEKNDLTYAAGFEKGCEDFELWVRCLEKGLKISNIQEVLLKYRWYPKNTSHLNAKAIQESAVKVQNRIIANLSQDESIREILKKLIHPQPEPCQKLKFKLWGIPIFKVKIKPNKAKGYLFGFIPLPSIKRKKK